MASEMFYSLSLVTQNKNFSASLFASTVAESE